MNVEVIAISTDTQFSHFIWKNTSPSIKKVMYPIASDHNGAVARAYGVYNRRTGMAYRGRFIINPKGKIMAVEVLTPPLGRNVNELIRQIKALQAIAKNPGKAAPAGWTPGKKLIGTGIKYIGVY